MQFIFHHLAPLCSSIRHNHKSIEQFYITYNHITFDCILDLGSTPFELMIGTREHNFACILHILPGYIVNLDELSYKNLCEVLHLNYSIDHFTSISFMNFLDKHLPKEATPYLVDPAHIYPFRANKLSLSDRAEGYIFCGWLRHRGMNNGHVRNLKKTELLLGKEIALFCQRHDISSKWTTDKSKQESLSFPQP